MLVFLFGWLVARVAICVCGGEKRFMLVFYLTVAEVVDVAGFLGYGGSDVLVFLVE